jgi:D-alanyl-D-alanine carboxypeptidase
VALMNQRAAELGMTHTHFVNPNGAFLNQDPTAPIPDEQLGIHHVTTASDMAKLTLEVAKHPEILQAGSTGAYTLAATNKHEARQIENANPLVHTPEKHPELSTYFYANATGLKTGTVSNIVVNNKTIRSYGNVVATASKNGLSLAALIYDDESLNDNGNSMMQSYKRWQLAADLFDYGFKTYAMVDIAPYLEADTLTRPIQAPSGAEQGDYKIASQNSTAEIKILLDSEDAQNLKNGTLKLDKQETIDDSLAPTVQTGDKVGSVQYTLSGNPVYKTDLVVTGKELAEVSAAPNSTPGQTGNTKASGGWPGWLLWVLIPGLAVAALFAVREINLYRRRHRRKRRYQGGMGGTEETTRRKL